MIEMITKISNVILPIFILMGIGAVCYYRKTLDTRTNNQLKSLTYNFTMPVMLFYFMTKTDGQMISYSYGCPVSLNVFYTETYSVDI